jgi:predicted transcriptional regulator
VKRIRRSRDAIICDILDYCVGQKVGLARIMQRVNLTTDQTRDLLSYLIERNLMERELRKNSGRCLYSTTPNGIKYFKGLESIMEMIEKDTKHPD